MSSEAIRARWWRCDTTLETRTLIAMSQRFALVLLRTLIGWHFLYEGYTKLVFPGVGTRRRADRALVVGGVPEGGDRAVRRHVPRDGQRPMDRHAGSRRCCGARGGRAQPDAWLLHANRLRRRGGAPRDVLPVRDSRRPARSARRGHVPDRQQEPDRGGGGARRFLVPHGTHRGPGSVVGNGSGVGSSLPPEGGSHTNAPGWFCQRKQSRESDK